MLMLFAYSQLALEPNMKRSIGMIAGGTGITPMYQVCAHITETQIV
jgi:NAD(P)H-flavin reductase